MPWTEVEINENDELLQIKIGRKVKIWEAIDGITDPSGLQTSYGFRGMESWGPTEEALSPFGAYSYLSPIDNPNLIKLLLTGPLGMKGGILPIDTDALEAISKLDQPYVTMTEIGNTMLTFSPAMWYRFFRLDAGIQYIDLNSNNGPGPNITSATTQNSPNPQPNDYYLIIRSIPTAIVDVSFPRGIGFLGKMRYDVVMALYEPVLRMAGLHSVKGASGKNDDLLTRALTAIMNYVYFTNNLPDPIAVASNPGRLATVIREGNKWMADIPEEKLEDWELDLIENRLTTLANDTQAQALDAGTFAIPGLLPSIGMFSSFVTNSEFKKYVEAYQKLSQTYTNLVVNGQLKEGDTWKFLNMTYAVLMPLAIHIIESTVEPAITEATHSEEKKRALPYLSALRDILNTSRTYCYSNANKIVEEINKDPLNALRNFEKYAYTCPVYGVIYYRAKMEFWTAGESISADFAVLKYTQYITRDTYKKVLEKIPILDYVGKIQREAVKFSRELAQVLGLANRVTIDEETEYTIEVNGQKTKVKGPTAVVAPLGDYYAIHYLIPIKNTCPLTNIFLFTWDGEKYQITPMNPVDPKRPFQPTDNDCAKSLYTFNEILNHYGAGYISSVEPEAWQFVAGIFIGVAVVFAISQLGLLHLADNATDVAETSGKVTISIARFIDNANQYQYKMAENTTNAFKSVAEVLKEACQQDPETCKQAIEDVMKAYGWTVDVTKRSQDYVEHGTENLVDVYKRWHEEVMEYYKLIGQMAKMFTPEAFARYLIYAGAFVAGISAIPILTETLLGRALGGGAQAIVVPTPTYYPQPTAPPATGGEKK